jgi:CO/xanthine dehydrogenase FAD-binding subunit
MPVADFIVGNRKTQRKANEILTAVFVPRGVDHAVSTFTKLGARRYLVISISMVAAIVQLENQKVVEARVAVGSCSAVARRLPALEAELIGITVRGPLGASVRPEHLASLSPIDDVRATATFRLDASLRLVQRALNFCGEGA